MATSKSSGVCSVTTFAYNHHIEKLYSVSLILNLSLSLSPPYLPAFSPPEPPFSPGGADFLEEPPVLSRPPGLFWLLSEPLTALPSHWRGSSCEARVCSLPNVPEPWHPGRPQHSLLVASHTFWRLSFQGCFTKMRPMQKEQVFSAFHLCKGQGFQ